MSIHRYGLMGTYENITGVTQMKDGKYVLFADHEKEVAELKQKLAVAVECLEHIEKVGDDCSVSDNAREALAKIRGEA